MAMQDGREIKSLVISGSVSTHNNEVSAEIPSFSEIQSNSWKFRIQSIGKCQIRNNDEKRLNYFLISVMNRSTSLPINNFFAVTCNLHSSEKVENHRIISSPTLLDLVFVDLTTSRKSKLPINESQVR